MQHAADVSRPDQRRQRATPRRLYLAESFAELRFDK